jgi:hypothetical protein
MFLNMLDQSIWPPFRQADIAPPHPQVFRDGIIHPDLWLWDSWVDTRPDWIDLYCLALARRDSDGRTILPSQRNEFPFHIRRFRSEDDGQSWRDCGHFLAPTNVGDGYCARNIWSGSCLDLGNGKTLHALTGLRHGGEKHTFLQTLFLAEADDSASTLIPPSNAVLCPSRDYEQICAAGYFLGPRDALGCAEGEEGGPILAWRDPFIWRDLNGQLHLLWSAKVAPSQSCVGHALVHWDGVSGWRAELQPPILLPANESITQAEVPKIYASTEDASYYLLISGCDRLHESQPENDVVKSHNLYRGPSICGPWEAYKDTSVLRLETEFLYGGSFLDATLDPKGSRFLAPYTERASPARALTFESVQRVKFGS